MFYLFRQHSLWGQLGRGLVMASLFWTSGCVDQRYDMTGDLDWTVGVGGQERKGQRTIGKFPC